MIARGDEAAVARQQRQLRGQRAGQAVDQGADARPTIALARMQRGRRPSSSARSSARKRGVSAERVAHRGEIARAAAAERDARQRALDIGAARAGARALGAQAPGVDEERHRVEPAVDRAGIGQRRRQMLRPAAARPRRSRCGRSRRAGCRWRSPVKVSVSSRLRRVAASISITAPSAEAARRREARQLALLRQLDIVDQRAAGGQLRPR